MLRDQDAIATLAVKDLQTARKFYEGKLGLTPSESDEQWVSYKSGGSAVFVYVSQYAGTNEATAVTWIVGDELDDIVRTLKGKGVTFEHYDMPNTTRKGDVHISGGIRNAWLKDPDGNILALVSGP